MGNDDNGAGANSKKFRDYAAECRRLAQRAPEKDRKILSEIAKAWTACADEAERREKVGSG